MTTATPTKQTPAEAIATVVAAHPGATAAELADAAGIGRSTAAKALAVMEQQGTARRSAGGRDGSRRLPDRWHPADSTTGPDPATAECSDGAGPVESDSAPAASRQGDGDETEPAEASPVRLGKGALRSLVFDYLADHAGPDGLSSTAVAKGLGGKSSGAVGNALARLEADGRVRLTSESPRRYTAE